MQTTCTSKHTSIPWLGDLPEHWEVRRIGSFFSTKRVKVDEGSADELLSVSEYYGVDFRKNRIRETDILVRADELAGYQKCQKNDLVMNIMLAWKGAQGISPHEGIISPSYAVFAPNSSIDPKYYHYLFRTNEYANYFKAYSTGIIDSRLRLYPDVFLKLKAYFPPLAEQHAIAAILDKKTAQLDGAIAEVEKSVQLLRELRAATISEAVTRGLNPNTPLRDSGVPWIGKVPEGWEITKVKFVVNIQNGSDPKTEGTTPVYGSGSEPFKTCGEYKEGPTVLLGRKGTLDSPQYITGRYWNVDTAFDVKPNSPNIVFKFFYYVTLCIDIKPYATNTAKPSMTQSIWENIKIPIPPLAEQQEVASYLDEKTSAIDQLVSAKQRQVRLLRELRASLIAEAVRGKVAPTSSKRSSAGATKDL